MAKKSTKAEVQKRTRLVLEMLLQATPTVDIIEYGMEKWELTRNGVEKYITEAYILMREHARLERDELVSASLAQRRYLKNKAIKAADYRLAHDIVKDEDKLLGLYPSDKVEHSGGVTVDSTLIILPAKNAQ